MVKRTENMTHSDENDNYAELAAKWLDGSISQQQRHKFNAWFQQDQDQPLIIPAAFAADAETHKARIYQKVLTGMEDRDAPVPVKLWGRIGIAAAICILFSVALYFYVQRSVVYDLDQLAKQYGYGSNVAVLTDQNGRQSLLEGGIFKVLRERGGFNPASGNGFASITTPRGSRYQVLLEDGTKVWLGAASSITYPVAFGGSDRTVRLSGAAYFEVAHQTERPFQVKVMSHEHPLDIIVTGTKFNVNAYPEEPEVQTRVFEGSVKLSSGKYTVVLTKGEKVIFKNGFLQAKVKNLEEDWMRSGTLHFDNEDIGQVMRMLAREYNVRLVYHAGAGKKMYLTGEISRKNRLEKVLHIIELATDYQFLFENGCITVFEPAEIRY